jgi:hypothetical protein
MARRLLLLVLAPLLGACVNVATVETAVPSGAELFEPRLVGTWELRSDTSLTSRFVITGETGSQYLVRDLETEGPSNAFKGRLGVLGPHRWIFELSPVGDTSRYRHPLSSKDSTRLLPPEEPLMLPLHMPLVIEHADSGLVFEAFRGDSVAAALKAGRVHTPYSQVQVGDLAVTLLLTEDDPARLNTALRSLASLPGVLIALPRVGHRVTLPAMH